MVRLYIYTRTQAHTHTHTYSHAGIHMEQNGYESNTEATYPQLLGIRNVL